MGCGLDVQHLETEYHKSSIMTGSREAVQTIKELRQIDKIGVPLKVESVISKDFLPLLLQDNWLKKMKICISELESKSNHRLCAIVKT